MKIIKRYKYPILILIINIILIVLFKDEGSNSIKMTKDNVIEMLKVIPPIFILLGLMDVWVEKETMIKYMGNNSGIKGILIAFILGSLAAGPLYASFPIAGMLLKKGVKLSNVFIFVGAWSTTKIPLLLFEASSMGVQFTVIRFLINIIGIIVIAKLSSTFLSSNDKKEIYLNAESI